MPGTLMRSRSRRSNTGDKLRSSEVNRASSASSPCSAAPSPPRLPGGIAYRSRPNGTDPMDLNNGLAFDKHEVRCAGRNNHERSNRERFQTRCLECLAYAEGPSSLQHRHVLFRHMGVGLELEAGW